MQLGPGWFRAPGVCVWRCKGGLPGREVGRVWNLPLWGLMRCPAHTGASGAHACEWSSVGDCSVCCVCLSQISQVQVSDARLCCSCDWECGSEPGPRVPGCGDSAGGEGPCMLAASQQLPCSVQVGGGRGMPSVSLDALHVGLATPGSGGPLPTAL